MSITFQTTATVALDTTTPCDGMGDGCTEEERCGYCDDGVAWDVEYTTPIFSASNRNAGDLQALLGLPVEEWGEIAHADIPTVLQKFLVVLNDSDKRKSLVSAPSESRGQAITKIVTNEDGMPEIITQGGCLMVTGGNTDFQTRRRLTGLRDVFEWAHQNNADVTWG